MLPPALDISHRSSKACVRWRQVASGGTVGWLSGTSLA
jgi:hypothetical protein